MALWFAAVNKVEKQPQGHKVDQSQERRLKGCGCGGGKGRMECKSRINDENLELKALRNCSSSRAVMIQGNHNVEVFICVVGEQMIHFLHSPIPPCLLPVWFLVLERIDAEPLRADIKKNTSARNRITRQQLMSG